MSKACWTPERVAYLRANYLKTPFTEMESHLGLAKKQIQDYASKHGITGKRRADSTLVERIRVMAANGFARVDLGQTARSAIATMRERGEIFMGGRSHDVRYFDSKEKADAYSLRPKKQGKAYKAPNMRPIVISQSRTRATWPADAPMVITKKTKMTVCPAMPDPPFSNTFSKY